MVETGRAAKSLNRHRNCLGFMQRSWKSLGSGRIERWEYNCIVLNYLTWVASSNSPVQYSGLYLVDLESTQHERRFKMKFLYTVALYRKWSGLYYHYHYYISMFHRFDRFIGPLNMERTDWNVSDRRISKPHCISMDVEVLRRASSLLAWDGAAFMHGLSHVASSIRYPQTHVYQIDRIFPMCNVASCRLTSKCIRCSLAIGTSVVFTSPLPRP